MGASAHHNGGRHRDRWTRGGDASPGGGLRVRVRGVRIHRALGADDFQLGHLQQPAPAREVVHVNCES